MRILLTASSGQLGRRVALRLCQQHTVVGVDERPNPGLPSAVVHHQLDLRRRPVEDVFLQGEFDAVVHLGMVHNPRSSREQLYARNVVGTETLLHLASKYGVNKLVLLSSGDVYGPMPTNSHFIDEDAPLMAGQGFPEIRALLDVDRAVQSFFWRHNEIETVILRPCHIIGPNISNAASKYLRLRIVPTLMGFDPMLQFIGENDLQSFIEAALRPGVRGVFNLASIDPVPLSHILKILNKPVLPLPHFLLRPFLERAWKYRFISFPAPELDHIRFNTVLDTERAREVLGIQPEQSLIEILAPFVDAAPNLR